MFEIRVLANISVRTIAFIQETTDMIYDLPMYLYTEELTYIAEMCDDKYLLKPYCITCIYTQIILGIIFG